MVLDFMGDRSGPFLFMEIGEHFHQPLEEDLSIGQQKIEEDAGFESFVRDKSGKVLAILYTYPDTQFEAKRTP